MPSTFSTPDSASADPLVLVLADDVEMQRLVRTALGPEHVRVANVGENDRMLAMVRDEHPDLIVASVDGSRRDGFVMARQLKHHAATAAIPMLAITGESSAHLERQAQSAGFDALLIQPVTATTIAHVVGLLIERATLLRHQSTQHRRAAADLRQRSANAPRLSSVGKASDGALPADGAGPVSPRCRRCGYPEAQDVVRTTPSSVTYRCGACGAQWRFTFKSR